MGRTADGLHQAYLTFNLNNSDAVNLAMLAKGRHLQSVDVSRNDLKSIKHLSGKASLVSLNVAGAHRTCTGARSLCCAAASHRFS